MPTPTPTPTPYRPTCPEWDVAQNETFFLCNCTMAKCIENNTIEIVPYECPPLEIITCTNGKKPVLVYDEYHCCQHYVCDCVCEGWGDPHYITFDGLFYSYQGNCTYVLMEEILPKHNLKIYIDNVFCDPTEDVSCPRSLIITYNSQAVALINHNLIGKAQLEALKNGKRLKLPYSQDGVKIIDSGINLVLEIPRFNVVIMFGITGFTVTLPYQYFGKNTQGHCESDCPSNKVYKPCGPVQQPTCEDNSNEEIMNITTEGCFCPDGMKRFNKESGVCVEKCGCLDPEGIPREVNEKFDYRCQNCICEESTRTVNCEPKVCPEPPKANCTGPGFVLVSQTNPSDSCCLAYTCQCQSSNCPVKNFNCLVGYMPFVFVPEGECCLEHKCDPKKVCVHNQTEYHGYEYVELASDECCGKCVQTHCALSVNGTEQLLEETIQTAANGCCKICVEREKACKLLSMKTLVSYKGCQSYNLIDIPYCEGSCNTVARYSEAAASMQHKCSCCKEMRYTIRSIDLHCLNGDVVPYNYIHVEECACDNTDCTKAAGKSPRRRRSFTLV
ncbi:hypothetical protein F2P81_006908 [Scophthalmus maximus]|uniref:Intestinal mucin-like protein n=1 Tax=Scophthalmus maximus TaxID=52904 RepID=A0A6A4TAW5_SCOMX|nr:hypothetical protein F2P81_006908 [Scophthalmus maximus]